MYYIHVYIYIYIYICIYIYIYIYIYEIMKLCLGYFLLQSALSTTHLSMRNV